MSKKKHEAYETTEEFAARFHSENAAALNEPVEDKKAFIVVAAFDPKNDSAQYHAKQAVAHLSEIGVEAKTIRTIDNSQMHLLVDASYSLASTPVAE